MNSINRMIEKMAQVNVNNVLTNIVQSVGKIEK
jgi:hypothetical protein